ncbi:MAG: hypothetical protein JNM39_17205 [Bdellovibrionaceae bacterium]|nr:hypothetical protein [Pseudobdellovibrionaceae bacterium]
MAKGSSSFEGLYFTWRTGKTCDAFRAFISKGKDNPLPISAKVHPTLKTINNLLKEKKLHKEQAEQNSEFKKLKHRLEQELSSQFALASYRAMEKIELKSKDFDFGPVLEEFKAFKDDTAIPVDYYNYMKNFWLPWFFSKGCTHPKQFRQYRNQAELHVKTAKKRNGEKYSHNTYNVLCRTINQFMFFCEKYDYIGKEDTFKIWVSLTLEQQKRDRSENSRSEDVYALKDLEDIKIKIDKTYQEKPDMKLLAYGLYFGVITGLRRGNFAGMKAENLFPDTKIPYFLVRDNIISGRSRGKPGYITQKDATKTSSGKPIAVQMVQPSIEIITEVARYLKTHLKAKDLLYPNKPGQIAKTWKRIAKECNFKYLTPLDWRHSYATIGAIHLEKMYKGNPAFLQRCCLHEDYRTTQGYIRTHAPEFLDVFSMPLFGG